MSVGLARRFAAICYDSLLLSSLLFIATLIILPFISNTAIDSNNLAYKVFLLAISYLYFCWQWQNGGQTLGMKSWQIKLVDMNNQNPNWLQLNIRFLMSLVSCMTLGAGFLWSLIDKNNYTLHDRLSSTKIIRIIH